MVIYLLKMVIFHSYVSLPEGSIIVKPENHLSSYSGIPIILITSSSFYPICIEQYHGGQNPGMLNPKTSQLV